VSGDSHHAGFEIVPVSTGAHSLRCRTRGETYHPKVGPAEEARVLHVEQQDLRRRAGSTNGLVLWDVGLGAAANAVAALEALAGTESEIHSFDLSLAPLAFSLAHLELFPHLQPFERELRALMQEREVRVSSVRWFLHLGDFRETMQNRGVPPPHSVFYDPYSPKANRELWTLNHFQNFRARLGSDCLLTNYTRSTAVRVTLLLAGFFVGTGRAIGEKDQTTIFATNPSALKNPLDRDWLRRVRVSGNAAPIRGEAHTLAPIRAEDWESLLAHPQFQAPSAPR
jgi:tRNA U34 5-methylaminomethyl-2-thiouridine-forming methyltransferase MnmC